MKFLPTFALTIQSLFESRQSPLKKHCFAYFSLKKHCFAYFSIFQFWFSRNLFEMGLGNTLMSILQMKLCVFLVYSCRDLFYDNPLLAMNKMFCDIK